MSKSGGSTVLEPRVGVRATAVALGLQREKERERETAITAAAVSGGYCYTLVLVSRLNQTKLQ